MPSIVAKLVGDSTHFDKTVGTVNGKIRALKRVLGTVGFALGANQVKNFGLSLIRTGSHITDVADKLGVTTDYLQEFTYAAKQEGVAARAAEMGLQRFTRRLAEAREDTGELLKVIRKYNIELYNADGTARSAGDVMADLSDIIRDTKDPAEQLRIAFKAFDSEGASLVNVLRKGSGAMRDWITEAHRLGAITSEEQLRRMDKYSDRIDKMTAALRGLATEALGRTLGSGDDAQAGFVKGALTFWAKNRGAAALRDEAERRIRENETVKGFGWSERVQTESGGWVKMSERIKQVTAEIRAEIEETREKAQSAAQAAEKLTRELARTKEEEARLSKQQTAEKILGWMQKGNNFLKAMNSERLRAEGLNKLDEKRRALLEQQSDALSEQARLQGELNRIRTADTNPTFQDYLSGSGGSGSRRMAEQILEYRDRLRRQQARQYRNEGGELRGPTAEMIAKTRSRLAEVEGRFEARTGMNLRPEEPLKAALAATETELKQINNNLKNL